MELWHSLCSKHDPFDKKYLCLLRVWLLPNVLFLVPTSELKCNYDILCVVSKIPFDKKCHSEHETFMLVESMATPKCAMLFLVPTSELCPQSPSEALSQFVYSQTGKKNFNIFFFSSLPCTSLSQKPLHTQFPWLCSLVGYSVCQIASQTSISRMLKHLFYRTFNILLPVFFLWKQQITNNGYT